MSDTDQITSGPAQFDHCDQCNAPVDRDQRYCVNCGNHRRHVPDPVAKYMGRVSAHTGPRAGGVSGAVAAGAVVRGAPMRRAGLGIGLVGALALALIPVAAAVGVAIGRSSNNQDSKLIAALERQRAAQVTTVVSSGAAAGSASSGTAATVKKTAAKAKGKSTGKHATTKTAGSAAHRSTSNGAVNKIAGQKVTAKAQQQGSQEAQKIEKSSGKNYVQGSNNLPTQVVVGP